MPKIVNKQEMQARILDAAMTCFLARGFHVTKMDDVAREAKLAKGTLYLYFKSKDEMMLALLRRHFDRIRAQIRAMETPQTLDAFLAGLAGSIPDGQRNATGMFFDVLGPGFQDRRAASVIGEFFDWLGETYANHLRALAACGELRSDICPESAAAAVVSMLDGLVIHLALFHPEGAAFSARRDAALELLGAGLRPAEVETTTGPGDT